MLQSLKRVADFVSTWKSCGSGLLPGLGFLEWPFLHLPVAILPIPGAALLEVYVQATCYTEP